MLERTTANTLSPFDARAQMQTTAPNACRTGPRYAYKSIPENGDAHDDPCSLFCFSVDQIFELTRIINF